MVENSKTWWKPVWLTGESIRAFVRLVMGVFAIILFGIGINIVAGGDANKAALAGVAIGGGGFCLIFFFLTQFKKFKGFGIEAESWEREMEDAKRITDNMRNLARLIAEPSIVLVMRTGRWSSGVSRREASELVERFKALLTSTEASQEDIEAAVVDYYRFTLFDMVYQLHKPLMEILNAKIKPFKQALDSFGSNVKDLAEHKAANDAWGEAKQKADEVMKALSLESLDADGFDGVVKAMGRCDLLSEGDIAYFLNEFKEEVADIRFFEEHKRLRRPEVWFESEEND